MKWMLNEDERRREKFLSFFISVDPYRITYPLDMENGYNKTECANNYNIRGVSAI